MLLKIIDTLGWIFYIALIVAGILSVVAGLVFFLWTITGCTYDSFISVHYHAVSPGLGGVNGAEVPASNPASAPSDVQTPEETIDELIGGAQ